MTILAHVHLCRHCQENYHGFFKFQLQKTIHSKKTSTLQILDDIEKELNSIKPISKNEEKNEENDDTLEDDLFNLIDSMYEGGDEEDD